MKNFLVAVIVFASLFSCGQSKESSDASTTDESVVAKSQLAELGDIDLYSDGKSSLIKKAHYRFEVKNVKQSTEAIEIAVKKYPAYISSSSLLLENPILENKITIRVQSEYFHVLLQEIDKQAVFVNFRNVETDDVSDQFVDLESRLKTKREVEERYMNILRKKAGTIEELLDAEQQIGKLHEEIEATIGRINYLKEQVRYSTISLEFYQTISERVADNKTPLGKQFEEAWKLAGPGW
jgi:hypothetical protein